MKQIQSLTDREIVQGLIDRDERITYEFFFKQCRPLFVSLIDYVFNYGVDYDEVISELYFLLIRDNERKLRDFDYRSSLFTWLKVVALRFLIANKKKFIADESSESYLSDDGGSRAEDYAGTDDSYAGGDWGEGPSSDTDSGGSAEDTHAAVVAAHDVEQLLAAMPNERYAQVIRRSMLDEVPDPDLAEEMQINVANLYNIKRRAMAQLTKIAQTDIYYYGKKR